MGNDSSKRTKPFVGTTILRVGIDDVAQAQTEADKAVPAVKVVTTLSTGQELTRANVCAIFGRLVLDRSKPVDEGRGKKKKEKQLKLDYERTLRFLCDDLVFILKDKELRDGLLELSPEAFEQLVKSDDLVVPDETVVLLALGAWAERRAHKDELEKNPSADNGLLHPPSPSKVDLRGSDSLFKSLGEGAAKLLVPSPSSSSSTASSSSSDQESTTTTTATAATEEEGKEKKEADGEATAGEGEEAKKPESTLPAGGDDGGGDKDGGGAAAEPKEAQEDAPTKTLSKSQEELQVNLRGTAGLYATFAGAYVNMISDEEMARKLQDEELEDDKVRRKMMEEEDEKLARALQEGEIADGGALPTGISLSVNDNEEEEEEDLEPIPDYKLTPEYIDRIKKYMLPFVPHIRFSMLPLNILNTLANEHLVPTQYLTEAFKYHALVSADLMSLVDTKNTRYKRRKYICSVQWDRQWHGQNIQISADGKVATKTQSSWYSVACASEGFTQGKHFWAIKVEGDEPYIGITQKGNTSLDNYLGGNAQSWGFRTSYKYSSSHGNGHYGETFGRGDVIGMLLDMDTGSLTYFKNGKNLGVCFAGLPRTEKLYPAVGWRAGYMTLVDIDPSQYPDNFVVGLLS